jgi:hypothetical protein
MADDSVVTTARETTPPRDAEPSREWDAFPSRTRLELVAAEPEAGRLSEDLVDPFVSLGNRGRFSRTLAARVAGPQGGTVRELALKIQSDDYPIAELPGWSNPDVDAQWREQYVLWNQAAAGGAAPALVDVLPTAADGGATLLPPTLYCKKRRAFFTTPCPQCGAALETCRDDALLDRHGLPTYARSLERFLHCPRCRDEGRKSKFYSMILTDPTLRSRAPVGEQSDLYVALARLAREGGPIPCAGCANVPACYPSDERAAGEVLRLLTPLSFYDYRCLPLERLHFHYDEFAARLGGRRDGADRAPSTGTRRLRRYLFEDDPRGKLPLEILRLKLSLFTQLVTAVSTLHRSTGLPHLGLSPENVMVELQAAPTGLPQFYGFRTRLLGIGTARRRLAGSSPAELAVPLLEPPPVRDAAFAVAIRPEAKSVHAGVFAPASTSAAPGDLLSVAGQLTSDAFDLRTLSPKDAVEVTIRQGRPLPLSLEFLANPTPDGPNRATLRSAPFRAEPALAQQLRSLIGQQPLRATFVVHPCLHAPYDLQSLGLMLFTTLVVNERQPTPVVVETARSLADGIAQFRRQHPDAQPEQVAEFASRQLRQAEAGGPFDPRQMFDRPPAEGVGGLGPFWHAALVFGLRALSQAPGFGFCRGQDDFDPAHPEGPADHLLAELQILGHNIDAELLGMQGKRQEIAEAIDGVREELRPKLSRQSSGQSGRMGS